MPSDESLEKMTVAASTLGWTNPAEWPETFQTDFHTWKREHITTAADGEVQCAEYQDGVEWLIVYNE